MISKAPLVVIGMHRSGTTLLADVLSRSGIFMGNDAIAYNESNFFQRCNVDLLRQQNAEWDEPALTKATPRLFNKRYLLTEYTAFATQPLDAVRLLKKKSWGWKDPRNTFTLESWLNVFPNLHAIHIYRNGIDVSRSLYVRNAMLQPESKWHSPKLTDLHACFDLWEAYVKQAQSWKSVLGKRYIAVRYEDLVNVQAETVERLEEFCGRKLKPAVQHLVQKERTQKEPMTELDTLTDKARANQTLLRLGYAV